MKKQILFFILLTIISPLINAQSGKMGLSFSLGANYTTTSKLFLNPNSADDFIKNDFVELDDIFHYSLSVKYRLNEAIAIGVNTEIIRKTFTGKNLTASSPSGTIRIETEDGYLLVPVELNFIYLLPFSTDAFKFDMSGGIGFYLGGHIRKFGNAEISSSPENFPFGIQVAIGMEYVIFDFLSARFDMRFRDPDVKFKSEYTGREAVYGGVKIILPNSSFHTRVNLDGIIFGLALVYNL